MKQIMKKNAIHILAPVCLTLFAACSGNDLVQNDTTENGSTAGTVIFESDNLTTRTAMTHTFGNGADVLWDDADKIWVKDDADARSEEHTSELQSRQYLVCRL